MFNLNKRLFTAIICVITATSSPCSYINGFTASTKSLNSLTGNTISGRIQPDFNFPDASARELLSGIKVELQETSETTVTDDKGTFSLKGSSQNSGSLTIKISKIPYLARSIDNLPANGSIYIDNLTMWAGDIPVNGVQDNVITMADIMAISKGFNAEKGAGNYNADCDINKDTIVNMADIMIAARHFNKTAADYPPVKITVTTPEITPKPTAPPTQIIKDITPEQASSMIKDPQNSGLAILDVRKPEEFNTEHIKDAVNIDYYSADFKNQLNSLDKNKKYIVYCRTGVRGSNSVNIMKELNFREVYNILGGITRWKSEGYPVTQ